VVIYEYVLCSFKIFQTNLRPMRHKSCTVYYIWRAGDFIYSVPNAFDKFLVSSTGEFSVKRLVPRTALPAAAY